MSLKQHGGARPGAGRFRIRRTITKEAAQTLRLLAWRRYGRPTTDDEENALICQLIEEERQRVAPAPSAAPTPSRSHPASSLPGAPTPKMLRDALADFYQGEKFVTVASENQKASFDLTASLLGSPLRHVALITALPTLTISCERLAGFQQAHHAGAGAQVIAQPARHADVRAHMAVAAQQQDFHAAPAGERGCAYC